MHLNLESLTSKPHQHHVIDRIELTALHDDRMVEPLTKWDWLVSVSLNLGNSKTLSGLTSPVKNSTSNEVGAIYIF